MFTRQALAVAVLVGVGLCGMTASAQQTATTAPGDKPQGEVNRRLERQQDRIQAGVADDQLTRGEAARLAAHDEAIHDQERADRAANGGQLTPAEKKQLNREENRNSRRIYRDRHNRRKPKS